MPRALILAAHSFVGRHLHELLASRGVEVVGTVRAECSDGGYRACDLTDAARVEALVAEVAPDWVINLSGATATSDPRAMYALHVSGTLNLLSAVRAKAPQAVTVLIGSAAEYGAAPAEELPLDENSMARPTSFFGASKLAQTQAALAAAGQWRLRVVCLRPFNILGPGLPEHYMPAAFAARLRASQSTESRRALSLANGNATRDFVDVRDVAEAIHLTIQHAPLAGSAALYNVASNSEVTIRAVAEHLANLAGGFAIEDEGAAESRSGVSRSRGSAERLRGATGWRPRIDWRQSLTDMWRASELASESRADAPRKLERAGAR